MLDNLFKSTLLRCINAVFRESDNKHKSSKVNHHGQIDEKETPSHKFTVRKYRRERFKVKVEVKKWSEESRSEED